MPLGKALQNNLSVEENLYIINGLNCLRALLICATQQQSCPFIHVHVSTTLIVLIGLYISYYAIR